MSKKLIKQLDRINDELVELHLRIDKLEQEKRELEEKIQEKIERRLTSLSEEQFTQQEVNTETEKLPREISNDIRPCGAVYLGEIYIFSIRDTMEDLYKLDNRTLEWRRLVDMNEPRGGITNSCLEWNGSIWVFGGYDGNGHLKSVERYDPKDGNWTRVSDMKYARSSAAATDHNNKFIVCGGYNGSILKNVECFEPESGIWIELTDLPAPRSAPSLISFENRLILMGGSDGSGAVNSVWELGDLKEGGTWKVLPSMRHPRHSSSALILNKEIYLIGGDGQPRGVEIFDGEKWRNGHRLPIDCDFLSCVVIPNNLVDTLRER